MRLGRDHDAVAATRSAMRSTLCLPTRSA